MSKRPQLTDDIETWNTEDAADLDSGNAESIAILVSSRDWTVETMVDQIRNGNIDLDPAFQRRNAWRDNRRSRLIESLILNFPVPQIVLAEHPKKKKSFIVIDGKQRLLTIASFYDKDYRDYWNQPKLTGLRLLKPLNKVSIDTFLESTDYADERRQLGNADIRTTIISGFQNESILYDIFYRINTGSVPLSSQELRQVLNRGDFAQYLMTLTSEENPLWELLGIDSPDPRLRDVELLLRLVAWRLFSKSYKGNMKPFLDGVMDVLNKEWGQKRPAVEKLSTDLLAGVKTVTDVYGDNAGRKYKNGRFEYSLNRVVFEVQAHFFAFPAIRTEAKKKKKAIVDGFKKLSADTDFVTTLEATTKSIENYKVRFTKYRSMLASVLNADIPTLALGK